MVVDRVNLPRIVPAGLFTVVLEKDARFTVHTVSTSQKTAQDALAMVTHGEGECDRAFILTRKKGQRGFDVVASSRVGWV